jgi:hypothetical protein
MFGFFEPFAFDVVAPTLMTDPAMNAKASVNIIGRYIAGHIFSCFMIFLLSLIGGVIVKPVQAYSWTIEHKLIQFAARSKVSRLSTSTK